MGRELSSLEDALAVIRDLSAFIDKQAEEILNLKKELAATRAEIIPLKTENAALKKQNAKLVEAPDFRFQIRAFFADGRSIGVVARI